MKTTSVIIASYNGERYIAEQLDSIAAQTIWPTEVIISDDGSTDHTIEVITNWLKSHETFSERVSLKLNMSDEHGYVANFENALRFAHGDYIFFCDQDDLWCENKVEEILSVIKKNNEKVIVHNSRVLLENSDGTFSLQPETLLDQYKFNAGYCRFSKVDLKYRLFCCIIQGMCMVVERNYLLSLLPFSRGYGHDHWVQFCATADESVVVIEIVLVYYRIHKNNLCGISKYNINKAPSLRNLFHQIFEIEKTTVNTIIKQTVWWTDCYEYASKRNLNKYLYVDDRKKIVHYYILDRCNNLVKCKIPAIISLKKAYKNGMYQWDGKKLYIHEILFVLMHTKTRRRELLSDINEKIRVKGEQFTLM